MGIAVGAVGKWAEYGTREVDATGSNRVQLLATDGGGGGDILRPRLPLFLIRWVSGRRLYDLGLDLGTSWAMISLWERRREERKCRELDRESR
jgi:hypothetical protein